jgi:hypothetical protein
MKKAKNRPDKSKAWGKRSILIPLLTLLVAGCAALDQRSQEELEAAYGVNPPVLADTYAARLISPGDDWFIYLKGHDPDGDLRFIHVWLEVPIRPTTPHRITIDPEDASRISGYIYLATNELGGFYSQYLTGWLRVMVTLEDRAGHRSRTADHTLYFQQGAVASAPPDGRFEDRFLGKIPPELFPFGPGGDGGGAAVSVVYP